jgi:ABC-type glycerol-3-phosphate transport system permease component
MLSVNTTCGRREERSLLAPHAVTVCTELAEDVVIRPLALPKELDDAARVDGCGV